MDIFAALDELIEEVKAAKPVPLSASAMINKESLIAKLEALKAEAPEELKQARWMTRDREELMNQTSAEAEKIVTEARQERDRLVARTEIVAAANREADKIIDEAKTRSREIRMEAEDYVDAKLANFEVVLQKTMAAVAKGRESLRGRLEVPEQTEGEPGQEEQGPEGATGNVKIHRP